MSLKWHRRDYFNAQIASIRGKYHLEREDRQLVRSVQVMISIGRMLIGGMAEAALVWVAAGVTEIQQ